MLRESNLYSVKFQQSSSKSIKYKQPGKQEHSASYQYQRQQEQQKALGSGHARVEILLEHVVIYIASNPQLLFYQRGTRGCPINL